MNYIVLLALLTTVCVITSATDNSTKPSEQTTTERAIPTQENRLLTENETNRTTQTSYTSPESTGFDRTDTKPTTTVQQTTTRQDGVNLLQIIGNSFSPLLGLILGDAAEDPLSLVSAAFQGVLMNENGSLAAAAGNVSQECAEDLNLFLGGLNQTWALAMLDSMGKVPSNLLGGNFKWMGNQDECDGVTVVENDVERFTGKYCRLSIKMNFMPDIIKAVGGSEAIVGVCASNRCSSSDVDSILRQVLQNTGGQVDLNGVWCIESREIETDVIVVLCILSFLGFLVLLGTIYDIVAVQGVFKTKEKEGFYSFDNPPPYEPRQETTMIGKLNQSYDHSNDAADVKVHTLMENGYGSVKASETSMSRQNGVKASEASMSRHNVAIPVVSEEQKHKTTTPQRGVFAQIILSFSLYTNGCKLLSTNQGAGTLGAVNGIRFLSMAWVILGHSYHYGTPYAENVVTSYMTYFGRWTFSAIFYATVSVDSFFLLSGVLVAYLTLKELKKVGGAKKLNWAMFYFHRFWRLTPPYMLVLMVGTVLWPYFSLGALSLTYDQDTHSQMYWCRDNWWTNLLYVNNYVKTKEMCMGHSWYLANDMQYYMISPIILLPLFYNVIAGSITSLAFMVASITATAVITYQHEYIIQSGIGTPQPKDDDYFKNIYIPSYARMGPYIVGLLTGYLLYRWQCKCRIPRALNLFLWLICLAMCCVIVYCPYTDEGNNIFTNLESTMYMALARTGWGVAVAWIIFACATGNGGWINQVLSWSPFIPLGRLSYCAYLIHPIVMVLYFENRAHAVYFSDYDLIYMFLGHMALTYGASFIVSLIFESPMMGLEKAIFKRKK